MMKKTAVFVILIALVVPLTLTGCCRTLSDELERTRAERDALQAQVADLQQARVQPAGQTKDLTGSLAELQKQVNTFVSFREEIQRKEDELARLRASALAEAQSAQARMDQLGAQLQAETERVREQQGQLQHAQTAITELQQKLKP